MFPSTPILDDFDRVDQGPEPSTNWTAKWYASAQNGLKIVSNQVKATNAGGGDGLWNPSTFGPDAECYSDYLESTNSMRLWARINGAVPGDLTNLSAYGVVVNAGTTTRFFREDGPVTTQLGASLPAATFAANDSAGMRVVGSTIGMWRKRSGAWLLLDSRSDSTYTTAGYIGLYFTGGTSISDNFGGGTMLKTHTNLLGIRSPIRYDVL